MTGITYWLLEVLKLSVIISCKKLPLDPKDFFIVAEITKLFVVGLVMLGLQVATPEKPAETVQTNLPTYTLTVLR